MARSAFSRTARMLACLHTLLVVVLIGLPLSAIAPPSGRAQAQSLQTVTNTNDSGPGSLRDLLLDFMDGATIDFDPALAGQTITLVNGELPLLATVTIRNTSGGQITIDGGGQFRVFHAVTSNANARANATIQGIAIQNGRAETGGGVLVDAGSALTLDGIVVRSNVANGANGQNSNSASVPSTGGGPGFGGGIANAGTLIVRNTTVANNQAFGGIGGLGVSNAQAGAGGGAGLGGGLFNTGTATVTGSTFTGNEAGGGLGGIGTSGGGAGASMGAGIFHGPTGTLKLSSVTLDGNAVRGVPGGVGVAGFSGGTGADGAFGFGGGGGATGGRGGFGGGGGGGGGVGGEGGGNGGGGSSQASGNGGSAFGGGLLVDGATASVAGSTVSGNTLQVAAGLGVAGSRSGGGIYLFGATTSLRGTIVAGNEADNGPDVFGAVTSRGYNLIQDAAGTQGLIGTDKTGVDPQLGALQVNAPGRSPTRALQAGSASIDMVPASACLDADDAPLTTDARGVARPADGDADGTVACDAGAFERTVASLQSSAGALGYVENAAPVPVDPHITVADTGFAALESATVQIAAGYAQGQDLLGVTPQNGITGTFNSGTGTLSLTGHATLAQYQTALRTVTYQNTSDAPSTAPRTVRYSVRGTDVSSNAVTRQVAVTAVNDPPIAADDSFTVAATQTLSVPSATGVLKNDTDVDSTAASLTATIVANPQHGSVALAPDGGFTYTPAKSFSGSDSFTYRASDGTAQSNAATVTISVTASACAPRPRVQTATAAGGARLGVHVEATPLNTPANNVIQELRFGTLQNAVVTINGQPISSGQTYTLAARAVAIDFTVERSVPGLATTVPFTVVDGCGQWPTFVGGGTRAGF